MLRLRAIDGARASSLADHQHLKQIIIRQQLRSPLETTFAPLGIPDLPRQLRPLLLHRILLFPELQEMLGEGVFVQDILNLF